MASTADKRYQDARDNCADAGYARRSSICHVPRADLRCLRYRRLIYVPRKQIGLIPIKVDLLYDKEEDRGNHMNKGDFF